MTFKIEEYCLPNESWKPIPLYEEVYEASSLGRIRTIDGKLTYSVRHGVRKWKGRILKNKTKVVNEQTGYRVTLWLNKQSKDWLVARLVCMAFYGIPNNFNLQTTGQRMTVNHIDGNRLNNKVENLEWCTLKENIHHAFKNGLMNTQRKTGLIDSKGLYKEFRSMSQAGIYLGRNEKYISNRLIKKKFTATDMQGNEYKIVQVLQDA